MTEFLDKLHAIVATHALPVPVFKIETFEKHYGDNFSYFKKLLVNHICICKSLATEYQNKQVQADINALIEKYADIAELVKEAEDKKDPYFFSKIGENCLTESAIAELVKEADDSLSGFPHWKKNNVESAARLQTIIVPIFVATVVISLIAIRYMLKK